jgi:myo-inositol 2-dehydrogenase/D-chiro-inositol 1-dehydrogenase
MNRGSNLKRREFLGGAVAAGGFMILRPELVRGTAANSAVRLGFLGCGSRGTGVATAMVENTNTRVTALADLFADQLERARANWDEVAQKKGYAGIDSRQVFKGPKAYEQIAASKEVDAILLSTPDYFHVEHLEPIVEAGKHVYCEKPAGVDVVSCKRFIEVGKRADGRLSLAVGFNVRWASPFTETIGRIQGGAIGKIGAVAGFYHAPGISYPDRGNISSLERRIRNFYWDRVLSGDVIVDQNIHIIDLCNWGLQARPLKACGTGGRKIRTDPSDIWDHWSVSYTYPGDIHFNFNSVQFGDSFWDVGIRFLGGQGVGEAYYKRVARITGANPWTFEAPAAGETGSAGGDFEGLKDSEPNKVKAFYESIVSGKFLNESKEGAESALSAILGRMACYSGEEVTWDEMMGSNQSYQGEIDLSKL